MEGLVEHQLREPLQLQAQKKNEEKRKTKHDANNAKFRPKVFLHG
jgi:hypothetical protein